MNFLVGGLRTLVALAGIYVMYIEGLRQPQPGVGFVVGMVCIFVAVVRWRRP